MRYSKTLPAIVLLLLCGGCLSSQNSPSGFRLPEGDAERGKAAFLELKCNRCHQVAGAGLPSPQLVSMDIPLGGELPYPRTDGDLVSSIINPSYKFARGVPREFASLDGKSLMQDYNDMMTVRQLADLVAFLHTHYTYIPPQSLNN